MDTVHLQKVSAHEMDQGLLNQAVGFFNAASRCFSNIAISPLIQNSPMTAGVVCSAFSVELYLKLVHVLSTGKPIKGHKLLELFESLPEQAQSNISTKFGDSNLKQLLAEASNAFVEWRYEHEHEGLTINPSFLLATAKACHLVAKEMKPELTVFGENVTV